MRAFCLSINLQLRTSQFRRVLTKILGKISILHFLVYNQNTKKIFLDGAANFVIHKMKPLFIVAAITICMINRLNSFDKNDQN